MDPVVHFEMPYDDAERIVKFYRTVFGWELKMLGKEMGDYVLATTAKPGERVGNEAAYGAIGGGFFKRNPDWPAQYPSVVIAVQDIKAAMKKIKDAGGEVLGEIAQYRNAYKMCYLRGPDGIIVALAEQLS